ncbi:MAG: FeoB-associated Cys-rich membrane protein [Anaerovoracaceae bacterium]|nr:FeoB-associated Cys-rich membrane protein [Bacillota bacterium]MDY2670684.1 FeoB-associated Cys-rich membrane protein [Anaerovoracaceae bacterium]
MSADIIIMALVLGYCAFIVYKLVRGKVTGKGNPFSCTGDCQGCMGTCQTPAQQEKLYREIKESISENRRMKGTV